MGAQGKEPVGVIAVIACIVAYCLYPGNLPGTSLTRVERHIENSEAFVLLPVMLSLAQAVLKFGTLETRRVRNRGSRNTV